MSFFYKENSPLCFFCIAGCPDFILLYVPEVLSQKHFEKCSDCLGSRCFDLAIVHSLVQLAFGGSHKGGSGGSADDVGGSTSHISNAGNGRKQDEASTGRPAAANRAVAVMVAVPGTPTVPMETTTASTTRKAYCTGV